MIWRRCAPGYDSQKAAVRKAMMDAFPSLQLTVGRARDTANNQTIDPAVNFTLPLFNRNRGGIAVAKATRAQLRAEYAARLFAARADIAELVGTLTPRRASARRSSAQAGPIDRHRPRHRDGGARGAIVPGGREYRAPEPGRQTARPRHPGPSHGRTAGYPGARRRRPADGLTTHRQMPTRPFRNARSSLPRLLGVAACAKKAADAGDVKSVAAVTTAVAASGIVDETVTGYGAVEFAPGAERTLAAPMEAKVDSVLAGAGRARRARPNTRGA